MLAMLVSQAVLRWLLRWRWAQDVFGVMDAFRALGRAVWQRFSVVLAALALWQQGRQRKADGEPLA